LGTLVTGNTYRHPSVLAKIGATLDVLSKGRLFMGIGAAWNEEEASAYGIPFPPTGERMRRLEEAVQIIKAMWTQDRANFDGKYYHIRNAYCNPKPIQKPYPPIMIGGGGERETLKIAAKYADACNIFGSVETVKHKLEVLRKHCKAVGRDYESILKTRLGRVMIDKDPVKLQARIKKISAGIPLERLGEFLVFGTPEEIRVNVEEFRDAGIEYFITGFEPAWELEELELFGEEVLGKF
jgi:F420-dependent oxidoreductase-like protein